MQIPSFLLDEWLNHYHFADTPPKFDLASSTGPRWTAREILGLTTAEERERFDEAPLVYSAASGSVRLRQALGQCMESMPSTFKFSLECQKRS